MNRTYPWLLIILFGAGQSRKMDEITPENRPYKFAFNIKGYQHRSEEKSEIGLIKGEYGFITADGYYRVTVYATDENGDFKILSMKNYYVGFPPEDPTIQPLPMDKSANDKPSLSKPLNLPKEKTTIPLTGHRACSDCLIPINKTESSVAVSEGIMVDSLKDREIIVKNRKKIIEEKHYKGSIISNNDYSKPVAQIRNEVAEPKLHVQTPSPHLQPLTSRFLQAPYNSHESPFYGKAEVKQASEFEGRDLKDKISNLPGTDKISNSHRTEKPQTNGNVLPQGIVSEMIEDLLYRFNYIVGFHGHHEDGYKNKSKKGDYFFADRDGVERKVEYVANEFGYQPNITYMYLSEHDVRRPKEDTEKQYGLKGYEFKWFYRK